MKIAFLDSGIGGLSVAAKLFEKKQGEFLYYADSDYMPYGALTENVLKSHLKKVSSKLISLGAGVIVLACNTATAVAIDDLREEFPQTTFVGTEPAVKPALCFDKDVIVLATPLTLRQKRFSRLLTSYDGRRFITPDCGRLAYLIERDYPDMKEASALVDEILAPFAGSDTKTVVIGCTHYTYLEEYIKRRYAFNVVSGTGGVVRQIIKVADKSCFSSPSLLRVYSGISAEQSVLQDRAKAVCKVEVAPF